MSKAAGTLEKYIPPGSIDLLMKLLRSEPVELKITKPRKTKFGDYRFPKAGERHRISVNANLNPFAFIITVIHEMAHLKAFKDHGKFIKPHGAEWAQTFRELSKPFIEAEVFPKALEQNLIKSLNKGAASSCTDIDLFRALKEFDETPDHITTVEQIEPGGYFRIDQTKVFQKGPKSRKRYRCLNLSNGREYMVHPLAEVKKIDNPNISKSA